MHPRWGVPTRSLALKIYFFFKLELGFCGSPQFLGQGGLAVMFQAALLYRLALEFPTTKRLSVFYASAPKIVSYYQCHPVALAIATRPLLIVIAGWH